MDDGSRVCSYTEEDRWQDKAQSDAAEAVEIVVQVSAAHRQGQEKKRTESSTRNLAKGVAAV
jgi:hypothetical protein